MELVKGWKAWHEYELAPGSRALLVRIGCMRSSKRVCGIPRTCEAVSQSFQLHFHPKVVAV